MSMSSPEVLKFRTAISVLENRGDTISDLKPYRSAMTVLDHTFNEDKCGICEQFGSPVFWFSPISTGVHQNCYEKIKSIEGNLCKIIDNSFKLQLDRNEAHHAALMAIRIELGGTPIQKFLDTKGPEKLKEIFDTIGVHAAKLYPPSD